MARIMGLDVGDRTIGVALTDPEGRMAFPHTTIRRTNLNADLAALGELISQCDIGEVVVGLPRSLSGQINFQAEKTLEFIDRLKTLTALPIQTWNERFSTVEAHRNLDEAGVSRSRQARIIDQAAASVILQSYLEYREKSVR